MKHQTSHTPAETIDLVEIIRFLWSKKLIIFCVPFAISILVAMYTLILPDVYRSEAVVQLVREDNNVGALQNLAGQFGGLASLAGLNLQQEGDDSQLALDVIKSRAFILDFIKQHNLQVPIVAAQDWKPGSNTLVIDESLYSTTEKKWLIESDDGQTREPTNQELYDEFTKLFSVSQSLESGLVTIAIEFYSPYLAKEWVNTLQKTINRHMKERALEENNTRIQYLQEQLINTDVANIRGIFSHLIEQEYQSLMLAETRPEYVFKTIDPAYVPDEKSAPLRAIIVIVTGILAGLLTIFSLLIHRVFNSHSQ